MPPGQWWKCKRGLLAEGYCSSSFSLGFLLEQARRKSNNTTIKSYSKIDLREETTLFQVGEP